MPAYNAERYVREAVESVLAQTFSDLELIVVDDGSTDATPAALAALAAADPRLVIITLEENGGYTHALNLALQRARGSVLARQDADDSSLPERLARQVEALDADPDLVIVGTAYTVVDGEGHALRVDTPPGDDPSIRLRALAQNPFAHSTVALRADVLREHGLRYDTSLEPSEDYGLWSEMLRHGRGRNLSEPLVRYRVHDGQVSSVRGERQESVADAIALRNLVAAGLPVDPARVRRLRELGQSIPGQLAGDDLALCAVLLDAASRLLGRGAATRSHRRGLARRIARALPPRGLLRHGLAARIAREDPLALLLALLPHSAQQR
jgi:hypothetical protein